MTYAEALKWSEYMKKRGTLNLGMRLESGLAHLQAMVINRTGGYKGGGAANPRDFMPHADKQVEQTAMTLAQAMELFK
ncbi:MAG: hypothetical protein V4718_04525 [Pseudomonadota bacterium]